MFYTKPTLSFLGTPINKIESTTKGSTSTDGCSVPSNFVTTSAYEADE
jgi:hypothetical protein